MRELGCQDEWIDGFRVSVAGLLTVQVADAAKRFRIDRVIRANETAILQIGFKGVRTASA